jgi:hypothetical protein
MTNAATTRTEPAAQQASPQQASPKANVAPTAITLDDLLRMKRAELADVMTAGHAIDPGDLAGYEYKGVSHGMPDFVEQKVLWKTFKKTFYADPSRGVLRGWNIRIEQTGIAGDYLPMLRRGAPITFGHYVVQSAMELGDDGSGSRPRRMPRPWNQGLFLDYGKAGNSLFDPALPMRAPLVAVNAGSADLLLGWDYVQIGRLQIPTPAYWSLTRDRPLRDVVAPPKG